MHRLIFIESLGLVLLAGCSDQNTAVGDAGSTPFDASTGDAIPAADSSHANESSDSSGDATLEPVDAGDSAAPLPDADAGSTTCSAQCFCAVLDSGLMCGLNSDGGGDCLSCTSLVSSELPDGATGATITDPSWDAATSAVTFHLLGMPQVQLRSAIANVSGVPQLLPLAVDGHDLTLDLSSHAGDATTWYVDIVQLNVEDVCGVTATAGLVYGSGAGLPGGPLDIRAGSSGIVVESFCIWP